MHAYFDTSSVVPLLINEPTTSRCEQLWDASTRVLSSRLLYPEALAALAQAQRSGRLTASQHTSAITDLDAIVRSIDFIELDGDLAKAAGEFAQRFGLRGYDAVHLVSAIRAADGDYVLVTGDGALASAARTTGLMVASTAP